MVSEEGWKEVVGFPNYQVSNRGRVQSLYRNRWGYRNDWRVLKPTVSKGNGRLLVNVYGADKPITRQVSHLVLEAFVGPKPEAMSACHRDDNPINNRIDNLYWGTYSSNREDAYRNGRHVFGSKHPWSKLTEQNVCEIREEYAVLTMEIEATRRKRRALAEKYGISFDHVRHIASGQSWPRTQSF